MKRVRTTARASIVACALTALAFISDDARACVIIVPTMVMPRLEPAPTNTHVWIRGLTLDMYAGGSFVLTTASGPPVALTFRAFPESMVWELVPAHELAPSTRYEVWGVPKTKKPTVLLGTFRTGDGPDHVPPPPPAVTRIEQRPSAMSCPPFLEVDGKASSAPADEVLQAMWVTTVRGGIDYATPPAFVFAMTQATSTSSITHAELTNRIKPRRVGIRAIDAAGNLSAPVELDVGP